MASASRSVLGIQLRTERAGKPVSCVLTAGQRHEASQVVALLDGGDKRYTGRRVRGELRRRGIGSVIPRRTTEPCRGVRFDRAAYRERNVVERTINRLKQYRAIATRYEKLEVTFHALLTLACIRLWL